MWRATCSQVINCLHSLRLSLARLHLTSNRGRVEWIKCKVKEWERWNSGGLILDAWLDKTHRSTRGCAGHQITSRTKVLSAISNRSFLFFFFPLQTPFLLKILNIYYFILLLFKIMCCFYCTDAFWFIFKRGSPWMKPLPDKSWVS